MWFVRVCLYVSVSVSVSVSVRVSVNVSVSVSVSVSVDSMSVLPQYNSWNTIPTRAKNQ